jgi:capsular polysaccharide biosynthesis protein
LSPARTTYIDTLVSRKFWVCAATLLAGLAAGIYSLFLEDQYRASARLLVLEPSVESKSGGYYNVTNTVYTVDTYSSMLGNQELLGSVVRDLGLDFPPDRLTPQGLHSRVSVVPVKDTKLIEIGLVYNSPVKAKIIVNRVADRFVQLYRDLRLTEIETSQTFIRQQLDHADQSFNRVQDSLEVARAHGRIDQLQLRLQHLLEELKMFETDLEATRGELVRNQARLGELAALLSGMPEETVASTRDAQSTVSGAGSPDGASIVSDAHQFLSSIDLTGMGRTSTGEEQRGLLDRAGSDVARMRVALDELQNPPGRRRLTAQEWGERYRLVSEGLQDLAGLFADLSASSAWQDNTDMASIHQRLSELAAASRGELSQRTREEQRVANPLRVSLLRDHAETQVAVRGYQAKEVQLREVVASIKSDIRSVEDRLYPGMRDVQALEEETKVAANLKNILAEKYDQSRIEVAAKLGTMTLVDPALIPEKRIGPQRKLNVLLGMLLGFSVASAAALAKEFMRGAGGLSSLT